MDQKVRLGVVGSRQFNDRELMFEILDLFDPFVLVSGGARGADKIAEEYADAHRYTKIIYLPDWEIHGRSAGFVRNKNIVENSDMILAFWDGVSRGTKSTIDTCRKFHVPVEIIDYQSFKV